MNSLESSLVFGTLIEDGLNGQEDALHAIQACSQMDWSETFSALLVNQTKDLKNKIKIKINFCGEPCKTRNQSISATLITVKIRPEREGQTRSCFNIQSRCFLKQWPMEKLLWFYFYVVLGWNHRCAVDFPDNQQVRGLEKKREVRQRTEI